MPVLKYWSGTEWISVGAGAAWSTGDIKLSFLSTAPAGWLICDGSLVGQGTYPDLYAAIGHSANGGNDPGGSMFRLPDLRARVPVGKAASGTASTLGGTGGSNNAVVVGHGHVQDAHNHTQDSHDHVQVTHGHDINDPGHAHSISGGDFGADIAFRTAGAQNERIGLAGSGVYVTYTNIDSNNTDITIVGATPVVNGKVATNQGQTATNQASGVSGTDANMPAYQVVNYLIKT